MVSLGALIVFLAGGILAVTAGGAYQAAAGLARDALEDAAQQVSADVADYFAEVDASVGVVASWMREQGMVPSDGPALRSLLQPMIAANPHLSSALIADSRGREFSILRDPLDDQEWSGREVDPARWGGRVRTWTWNASRGTDVEILTDMEYDPRTRAYYAAAVGNGEGVVGWTPPTIFFVTRDPGITGGTWWAAPQGDTLVAAFDVLLLDLSRITAEEVVSPRGMAFALAEDPARGRPFVVGLPGDGGSVDQTLRRRLRPDTDGTVDALPELPRVDAAADPALAEAFDQWQAAERPDGPFEYVHAGEAWWAAFQPYALGANRLWIGVAAPEADFVGDLAGVGGRVAAVGLVAMLLAGFLATWLARAYASPLEALARAGSRLSVLDLRPVGPKPTRLKEVQDLVDEQERVRAALDSFSRYMPVEIVRQLLARGEAARLGGDRRVITILFTDIEGFTSIAEAHPVEEVTRWLTEYFDLLLNTIRSHGGEVNQLMGDGLVAYWGAPVQIEDHATQAIRGTMACQVALQSRGAEWVSQGRPALHTRFGIATGEVVVGNIGSPSRLAYAAVGDTPNLASRIEGLNRFYGTRVLASGHTREAAGTAFEWRLVDAVRAKGKRQIVELFEPLGERGEVEESRLRFRDRYEEALRSYRSRDFAGARSQLEDLAHEGADASVARLLSLVEEALVTPPPVDWDGATGFTVK